LQQVVAARRGDDDGALHAFLPSDFGEVDGRGGVAEEGADVRRRDGLWLDVAGEQADDLAEGAGAVDVDALDDRGLSGVVGGDDDAGSAALLGEGGHGDGALDGAEAAVEREFAAEDEFAVVEAPVVGAADGADDALHDEEADGDALAIDVPPLIAALEAALSAWPSDPSPPAPNA
jgi:hypothetical protein